MRIKGRIIFFLIIMVGMLFVGRSETLAIGAPPASRVSIWCQLGIISCSGFATPVPTCPQNTKCDINFGIQPSIVPTATPVSFNDLPLKLNGSFIANQGFDLERHVP